MERERRGLALAQVWEENRDDIAADPGVMVDEWDRETVMIAKSGNMRKPSMKEEG
jgi:hypothetical protein